MLFSCGSKYESDKNDKSDISKIRDENQKKSVELADKYEALYNWDTSIYRYSYNLENILQGNKCVLINNVHLDDIAKENDGIYIYLSSYSSILKSRNQRYNYKLKIQPSLLQGLVTSNDFLLLSCVINVSKIKKIRYSAEIENIGNDEKSDFNVYLGIYSKNKYMIYGEILDYVMLKKSLMDK